MALATASFAPATRVCAVIFLFVCFLSYLRTKRGTPETPSLVGIGGPRRRMLIEGLAGGCCEEHDEAREPKVASPALT